MVKGCFVILLPKDKDYNVLGYYFKQSKSDFEITSDLFLRLNLDHSKTEFNLLKLKNYTIVSYLHKFKGKLITRKALGIIIGLVLNEKDDPKKFRASLKNSALTIESINFLGMSKEEFETKLKEIYQEHLESLTELLKANALKVSVINRTKDMLSGGKEERKLAQELLKKIERNVHLKVPDFSEVAENAIRSLDYDKAEKFFNKAAEIAEELLEEDLAKYLRERAFLSQRTPDLLKKRDNIVKEAKSALKDGNFHSAYIFYRKASELSKELMQSEKEEEFTLKSKALQDFYQVDQRFKKKK
ncbi:MAG: hypothetical protein ACFFAN_02050 [Promethearchaeota archaeon]